MTHTSEGEGLSSSGRKPRAEGVKAGSAGNKLPLAQKCDFSTLPPLYSSRLRGAIYNILRNSAPNDVDDALQQTWLNAWRGWERFKGTCAVSTWLFRIAVNTALMWRRHSRKHAPCDESLESMLEDERAGKGRTPRSFAVRDSRLENVPEVLALRELLGGLSALEHDAVKGHFIEGRKYREMARERGVLPITVRSRAFRGVRRMKERGGRGGRV